MTRNGGKLLVESLIALGARKCFGVPGESYLAVLDALHDVGGHLDYVLCRNEGGAAAERVEATADFASAFGRALAAKTGAVLELIISPEALTPRQTLTQMRDAALASKKAQA